MPSWCPPPCRRPLLRGDALLGDAHGPQAVRREVAVERAALGARQRGPVERVLVARARHEVARQGLGVEEEALEAERRHGEVGDGLQGDGVDDALVEVLPIGGAGPALRGAVERGF